MEPSAVTRTTRRVSAVTGVSVCATGVVVFSGWLLGIVALRNIRPGLPNMAPATALGFILAGAALWLIATARTQSSGKNSHARIAHGFAALTALLGLSKLAHYGLGLDINVDMLGFAGIAYVSPATAVAFLLLGSALLLAGLHRYFAIFQVLALSATLLSAVGLVSFLYGGEPLLPYAEMALHTSLSFIVLGIGTLFTRTDGGLMGLLVSRTAGGWLTRRLLVVVPVVPIVIEWLEDRARAHEWFGDANPMPLFALLDVILLGAIIWIAGVWLRRVDLRRAREETMRRQHEQQLSLFVEHAPAAIAMLDRDMRYVAVSRRWLSDYRLQRQDLVGRSHYDVFPDLPPRWKEIHQRCLAGAIEECEEDAFPRADGRVDWVHWAIHPWRQKTGEVGGIVMFSEVITERVQSAERIRRLNRVYAVLSQINTLIVRTRERQALFDEACHICVEHGTFGFAWIGLYHAATNEIVPVASAGHATTDPPLTEIDVSEGSPQSQSVPARALHSRRAVYDNDIAAGNDPDKGQYAEVVGGGYRSIIALPLIVDDVPTGVVCMWAREPDFFDSDELKLLKELAGDIGFAMKVLTKQEELDYISYFDITTGLSNRTLFLDRLNQQLRARHSQELLALLLFDIERFSIVNDTLGRSGADDLLRIVAQRLELASGSKDNLARIGPDTFALVVSQVRDASHVAHRIEDRLLACFKDPFIVADTELRISAKIGIAQSPADGDEADTLLRNAEAALKQAKAGGSRYMFYAADMNARAAQALSLETRLREAVEAEEFVLYYQPKIRLDTGRLCGLEALIRWQHPETGLVPPGQFIPVLEETGLIVQVGAWAAARALADYEGWSAMGCQVPRIAVNVSAIQLREKDFAAGIIDIIEASGISPQALELEITESLILQDIDRTIRAFSVLRGMGIHVAIDDFGTGYSSLSYLARLPIDKIKIDRSFVAGMLENAQDKIVVSTIITLAHSFGLPVVAEGVETSEQAEALADLHCDEAQGFYFYRPLPPADTRALLSAPPG